MRIMVLNDGETWTNLGHCMVVDVPEDWDENELDLRDLSESDAFQLSEDGPVRLFTFLDEHDIQLQDKVTGNVVFLPRQA